MWTGFQWSISVTGLTLMIIAIISLAMFLAFYSKHYQELSQRVLNVLYAKLALLSIVNAILMFSVLMVDLSKPDLSAEAVKIIVVFNLFIWLFIITTFLEISISSLLRVFSFQLYMWVSLNTPHIFYNIIEAFLLVYITPPDHPQCRNQRSQTRGCGQLDG